MIICRYYITRHPVITTELDMNSRALVITLISMHSIHTSSYYLRPN